MQMRESLAAGMGMNGNDQGPLLATARVDLNIDPRFGDLVGKAERIIQSLEQQLAHLRSKYEKVKVLLLQASSPSPLRSSFLIAGCQIDCRD